MGVVKHLATSYFRFPYTGKGFYQTNTNNIRYVSQNDFSHAGFPITVKKSSIPTENY